MQREVHALAAGRASVQLRFASTWTTAKASIHEISCVQGTVEDGSGVRELLALLRSEEQWNVRLGDVNPGWGNTERVDDSTTEAQLVSTAAISISLAGWEDDADRLAARVRCLRLLRHLPHLKRLRMSACVHIMGD